MCDYQDPPVPPDPPRVARRALILAALTCRAGIDAHGEETRHVDLRLRGWLGGLDLGDELHPSEDAFLRAPFGSLSDGQRLEATWNAEGLVVIAWALGLQALPPHDRLVSGYDVCESVNFLSEDAAAQIASATLRPMAERRALRELMYGIDCRLCGLLRKPTHASDMSHHLKASWWGVLGLPTPLAADGDLGIDGRPCWSVEEERCQEVRWAVGERHRASIWLLGDYKHYAMTPADT